MRSIYRDLDCLNGAISVTHRSFTPMQSALSYMKSSNEPADVVALSLGSEFAAMAALQSPESIHTLTLLSPTGLGRTPAVGEGVYKVVSFPLWGRPLFDLLVIEPSLRFFLGKVFYGDVSEAYVEYAYLTGHQPGAHYAPLYFVAGQLFTSTVYAQTLTRS
jgi:pimeloyl-ACP methyl ester carboxylesterase